MKIPAVLLTVGLSLVAGKVLAQSETDLGKIEYQSNCASCHGLTGKGDGPLSRVLRVKPSDLTTIAKRNGGVFPANRVFEVIDGRQQVKEHGPREMPVWGKDYQKRTPRLTTPGGFYSNYRNAAVNAKIISLVDYLYRIQVK